MTHAKFESNAQNGTREPQASGRADFGPSPMERVQRRAALLQDVARHTVRFAGEALLDARGSEGQRQRLAQADGEAQLRAARARAAVAERDARYVNAVADERAIEEAATALPGVLRQMESASDPAEIERLAADYHDRFGRMESLPGYAGRIAPLAGQVGAVLRARRAAFAARGRVAADALAPEIDAADPEKLARIRSSPLFPVARHDAGFPRQFAVAEADALRAASRGMASPGARGFASAPARDEGKRTPIPERAVHGGGSPASPSPGGARSPFDAVFRWSPAAHDALLDHALKNTAAADAVKAMQQSSRKFDRETQKVTDSHKHSMRQKGQSVADAVKARDQFVNDTIAKARAAALAGKKAEALQLLGEALHPVMDSSSPKHRDPDGNPAEWRGLLRSGWGHSPAEFMGKERARDITEEIFRAQDKLILDYFDKVFKGTPVESEVFKPSK